MRLRYHIVIALTFVGLAGYGVAFACHGRTRCQITSMNYVVTTYVCDVCFGDSQGQGCDSVGGDECGLAVCPSWATANAGQPCDDDDDCGGSDCAGEQDGSVTKCYGSSNDSITGTSGNDVICGGGGNDTINGVGGADKINGGEGDDVILGGNGDDTLNGGPLATSGGDISGDDRVLGEANADVIFGNGGRDYLDGGSDNDTIATASWSWYGALLLPDDVVGTLICGGTGNDSIHGAGPSHQCIDGGAGTDICNYEYKVLGSPPSEPNDIGTVSCETCQHIFPVLGGTISCNSGAPCGCD